MNAPVLTVGDMRLARLLHTDPMRCASVNEYAAATGIDVGTLLDLLRPAISAGHIDVEPAGGEIFLHTAPHGRPAPAETPHVPANLWETLRQGSDTDTAFALWRIVRGLESAGWAVTAEPERIPTVDGRKAMLGVVRRAHEIVPLLLLPDTDMLRSHNGPLRRYAEHGVALTGIVCRNGELDSVVTAARSWLITSTHPMDVVILEEPRYQPVLLTGIDGAVTPRSVTITDITARP